MEYSIRLSYEWKNELDMCMDAFVGFKDKELH